MAAHVAGRDRQAPGTPPFDADREELRMPAREDRPLRAEEHLAVGREAADDVVAGVPGQPRRLAALGGDHVDVVVAVVAGRERDVLAIGREIRVLLLARVRRDPPGIPAVGVGHPDVVGVDERDLPLGDRRRGQQPRVGCVQGVRHDRDESDREHARDRRRRHPDSSHSRHGCLLAGCQIQWKDRMPVIRHRPPIIEQVTARGEPLPLAETPATRPGG